MTNADTVNYLENGEVCGVTHGGNDTEDKIFLPSIDEMTDTSLGFRNSRDFYDRSRICIATDYAKSKGANVESNNYTYWWLRSPGDSSNSASTVGAMGYVTDCEDIVYYGEDAIRPALHLNLSAIDALNEVGTVTAGIHGITYHYHSKDKGTELAATCCKEGSITYKCSGCGKIMDVKTINATGKYSYGAWKVVVPATETSGGKEERSCACGKKEERVIAKLSHAHTYGEWKETKNPTVFDVGSKERICSGCQHKEKAIIAKLKPTVKLSKTKVTLKKVRKNLSRFQSWRRVMV